MRIESETAVVCIHIKHHQGFPTATFGSQERVVEQIFLSETPEGTKHTNTWISVRG